MKVKTAINDLIRLGLENEIDPITANSSFLGALRDEIGERRVDDLSSGEIRGVYRKFSRLLPARVSLSDAEPWESRYAFRISKKRNYRFPWELDQPVGVLANLFKNQRFCPKRVLEFGCGDGRDAVFMAQMGSLVTAVDISQTAILAARNRAKDSNVLVEFRAGDILKLNFGRKRFDFIFDRGCFHHVPVVLYEEYINMVYKMLSPGGKFLLICHSQNVFQQRFQDIYGGLFARLLRYICDGQSETGFAKDEIVRLFQKRFSFETLQIIPDDDHSRPFKFVSALMVKASCSQS